MPSIDGRLEWDNDELTPGKKKEGGLHSTLFDADGNLKSSARFVPDEDDREAEPETVYMHVYHEVPAPAKTPEQEALEKAVAEQLSRLVDFSIEKLTLTPSGSGRTRHDRLSAPRSPRSRRGPR